MVAATDIEAALESAWRLGGPRATTQLVQQLVTTPDDIVAAIRVAWRVGGQPAAEALVREHHADWGGPGSNCRNHDTWAAAFETVRTHIENDSP